VQAITFDTLKYANRLKAAGMSPTLAEAEAEALSEVLEINLKDFATKQDLAELEQRLDLKLDAKLADTKAELIRWVVGAGFLQTALIVGVLLKVAHLS
jgi:hypothetical protein